jgi:hypothetical protein
VVANKLFLDILLVHETKINNNLDIVQCCIFTGMEKQSLAYSRSFKGTFGDYRFFDYLDDNIVTLPVAEIEKAHKILSHCSTMCRRIEKHVTSEMMRKWCVTNLRKELRSEAVKLETAQIRSRVLNYVAARTRSLVQSVNVVVHDHGHL